MRFLHTADWHVGQKVSGMGGSRHGEHEAALAEMLDIATRESVDCVLVAGDIFHHRSPQAEDDRLVIEFLAELLRRKITAVIICGNHENPKRLGAWRNILQPLGIHLCPLPEPPDDGGLIRVRAGNEEAVIAALPFVPERYVVDSWRLMSPPEEGFKDYAERVASMMNALASGFSGSTVNILLGHMYISEAEASGSEWAAHVSQPYAVPRARIPASAQYVALGHLHRPQDIAAHVPTRYAGSPLQLDFGEEQQRKSVTLVEALPGQPARVEVIPLSTGRALRTVEGTLGELRARAADFGNDHLRVFVKLAQPLNGLAEQVREFLPHAVQVRPRIQGSADAEPAEPQGPPKTADQQFVDWYTGHHTVAPSDRVMEAFRKIYEEAAHATD